MFRVESILWVLCWGLSPALSQRCEPLGWSSFQCREVSSLQELRNVQSLPTNSLHRLIIRNEHTDLSIDTANSVTSLVNLLELDVSQVPQLELGRHGFSGLPQLRHLNISSSNLERLLPAHFAARSSLQLLDASHNQLSALAKDLLVNLRDLIYANFSHNELQQLELPQCPSPSQQLNHKLNNLILGACPRLQQLDLSVNRLGQLNGTSFRGAESLLHLQLAENELRAIGKDTFEPLVQLRFLNLSHNKLDALRPQVFGPANNQSMMLQQLDLSSNNIRLLFDNQFSALGKLQVLDVSHNSIASLNPAHFEGLRALRKLFLQDNDIIEIKPHTFAALKNLDTLDLSHNSIESLNERTFGSETLSRLRKLNLNVNNLRHLHALAFSSLPFLEYLSLGNNQLTQLDVRMFAPMRHLQKLHLGNNELTHISHEVLDSLSSVNELLIDNNKLTSLPNLNSTLSNLKRVAIEGNPWQCPCFLELERWLLAYKVSYLRQNTGFYNGEKPLCVVTEFDYCARSLQDDRRQDVVEDFEDLLSGERSSDVD